MPGQNRTVRFVDLLCVNNIRAIAITNFVTKLSWTPLIAIAWFVALSPNDLAAQTAVREPYFGIQMVDDETGRGVPLVELRTVNQIFAISDSGGWVAFCEPELMDRDVYFSIAAPGYEHAADGFGNRGEMLRATTGSSAVIRLKRTNVAERLYRVTGEGIYRDSALLGLPIPYEGKLANALTLGQDSVQAVPYRGQIFWLWGDTNLAHYPLGNFHTTAATTPLPGQNGFDPSLAIPLTYFCDKSGQRVAQMSPDSQPGAVWLFGLLNVAGPDKSETLIAHYSRHLSLSEVAEQGLVRFNNEQSVFEKIARLDSHELWRFPRGNAVRVDDANGNFFYFTESFANTRVKADWDSVIDPQQYQALAFDETTAAYVWQAKLPPTTQAQERELVRTGKMRPEQARYQLVDAASGSAVEMHRGSVQWNPFWKKWLLIGTQAGDAKAPSYLGEIWLSTSDQPSGPWRTAIKIASHPNYSFYNPRQHLFFDSSDGRFIFFEGTFTRTFSAAPYAVPRYDYNQVMYRLDLSDERLKGLMLADDAKR